MSRIAGNVQRIGRERFPQSYAGVTIDPQRPGVTVYRVPDSAFDAALAAGVRDSVTVRDSLRSERQNEALASRILDEDAYWRARGVAVTSVAALADGRGVAVGVRGDVDRAQALLGERYGPDEIAMQVEAPTLPQPPVRSWPTR